MNALANIMYIVSSSLTDKKLKIPYRFVNDIAAIDLHLNLNIFSFNCRRT